MENPFKFGTIVEEDYFTDRVEEVANTRALSGSNPYCIKNSHTGNKKFPRWE